jgi:Malectin domain
MRKILGVLMFIFLAALCCPSGAPAQQPIRVNCGGPSYTDSMGRVWQADADYTGGVVSQISATMTGTADPTLYQTARRTDSNSTTVSFQYNFPVSNGTYHVNLYFAEVNSDVFHVGGRVFNVKIEGNLVFQNLDIFAEAGADAPLIKGADATVSNGKFTLEFDNVVEKAKVMAIEILPGASGPSLMLNFKYPDGTPVAGTLAYSISSSLLSFKGSEPLMNGNAQCVLLANPSALGISAQFQANLSLTDSAGHVLWQMSLAVNPSQVNLGAIQSSALNVVVQRM